MADIARTLERTPLAVNFQEVVHSVLTGNVERRLWEECNERRDSAAEQFALAADHLSGGNRRQRLFKHIVSSSVVWAAPVRYPLCDRLADDRCIRCPKHFSHPRAAPGRNNREAGSRYGSPRHGRPLLLRAQSALPRRHDTCTGDWTGLGHCVVFAACDLCRLRGAKARYRAGRKASTSEIRRDLKGVGLLPCHGRIDCRRCFGGRDVTFCKGVHQCPTSRRRHCTSDNFF